jgi:hypothetical protein
MPSQGMYQQPAGKKLACGCSESCACSIPKRKKMRTNGVNTSGMPGFIIEGPEYKGNAALNAQRS